jgi:hypothetical protein
MRAKELPDISSSNIFIGQKLEKLFSNHKAGLISWCTCATSGKAVKGVYTRDTTIVCKQNTSTSTTFTFYLVYFSMLKDAQRCSKMLKDAQRCSKMLKDLVGAMVINFGVKNRFVAL